MQKRRKIKLIGLTGGVSTGKSTVASMFASLGFPSVDTDKIAHRLMKKGSAEYKKIVHIFGDRILAKNGDIDREKVAAAIFNRSAKAKALKRKLEHVLHPAIFTECKKMAEILERAGEKYLIIEIPLLFEIGWHKKMDLNIVASCRAREERRRCKKRGFKGRSAFQLPLYIKEGMSDFIIDTSGSKNSTKMQVDIFSQILSSLF